MRTVNMLSISVLLTSLVAFFSLAFSFSTSLSQLSTLSSRANKTRAMVRSRGCNPHICFALDGSRSILGKEYRLQKAFVKLVASTVSSDPDGSFSAVQYGRSPVRITRRATNNISKFLRAVDASRHMKARSTLIAPGFWNCIRQMGRFPGQPKKIVLLGDGRTTFDTRRPPHDPASVIKRWKRESAGNGVCAVAVNFQDISSWTDIVGGSTHVYKTTQWLNVVEVFGKLVADVCGWDDAEF